jgi:AcrR family transcriptional regulator
MSELPESAAGDSPADPKRARILESALKVVLAYGFARATMDDVARAANISRPALYLLFKNKADIYRAVCTNLLNQSLGEARKALAQEGTLSERLEAAIEHGLLALLDEIARSPHGPELMDMKTSLAADIIGGWNKEMAGLLAKAICDEAASAGIDLEARGLSALAMATMLLDGLEGMKMRVTDPAGRRVAARRLIRVIVLALHA